MVAAILVLALLGAANASAAIRYATPTGTAAASTTCEQANPCSLVNAAERFVPNTRLAAGDEIVVEPGNYDLGPQEGITPAERTNIHGVAGKPRPVITFRGTNGAVAFLMNNSGETLSRLEIITTGRAEGVVLSFPGVVDGVVVRGSQDSAPCLMEDGVIRNTACLSTGDDGVALSIETNNDLTDTVKLRNVTAIATGANSRGLEAEATGNVELNVDAIGLLARGRSEDILAQAFSLPPAFPIGARVNVSLDHSDFTTIKPETDAGGGTATITAPGSSASHDILAEPILAADGYHELLGSPTIDKGATDPSSGATDIDGEQRVSGAGADIGADEFQIAITTTNLSCAPASVAVGDPISCTATVSSGSPTGTVKLTSDRPGSFANAGACTLAPAGQGKASCHLPYTPSAAGTHTLTASYQGDAVNSASHSSTAVRVLTRDDAAPNTTLKKKPPRKSAIRKATFAFGSDQPGSRFECKLDRKAFKPCRSPLRLKGLKPGRHTFRVRAVGPTGIADPTPASFLWKVS
jgi:hypothetical protein